MSAVQDNLFLKGFTLIELLVVIVIITILASVLLITFKGVDERAKLTNFIQFSQSQRTNFFNDLVGWWPFDELVAEGTSTTTIDNSFQRNNSVVQGGVKVAKGMINGALEFNGVNGYVDLPNKLKSFGSQGDFTIGSWFKTASANEGTIFTSGYWGHSWGRFMISDSRISLYNQTQYLQITISSSETRDGKWHYIAGEFSRSDNVIRAYLDGKKRGEIAWNGVVESEWDNYVKIGVIPRTSGFGGYFNGLIDEVQIYNAALPSAVIQQLYVQGLKRHQNLAINR